MLPSPTSSGRPSRYRVSLLSTGVHHARASLAQGRRDTTDAHNPAHPILDERAFHFEAIPEYQIVHGSLNTEPLTGSPCAGRTASGRVRHMHILFNTSRLKILVVAGYVIPFIPTTSCRIGEHLAHLVLS
eukprot:scaffold5902_cov376-Prasinococcus_capsulatus_cf.AAC.2